MTSTEAPPNVDGYGTAAQLYRSAGWPGVLPLPARSKKPVPSGFTGYAGEWPTDEQVATWVAQRPDGNLALRLPDGVIGIDVDLYKPDHADAWARFSAALPPLPPTVMSTSRFDGSGIRLFRVPPGTKVEGAFEWGEVVQRHHRYVIAWPSIHPDTGRQYGWLRTDIPGELSYGSVEIADVPELPAEWIAALGAPPTPAEIETRRVEGRRLLADRGPSLERWAPSVTKAVEVAIGSMVRGCRHHSMTAAAFRLARLVDTEHDGALDGWEAVRAAFLAATAGEKRPSEKEADDAWHSAWEKVAAEPSRIPKRDERIAEYRAEESRQIRALAPAQAVTATTSTALPVDEPPTRPSMRDRLLTIAQLRALPPPVPLVHGLLDLDSTAMLYGPRGSYKSFVAIDLGLCVATGTRWHGRQVEHGPVLYVVAEGVSGIGKRLDAWFAAHPLTSEPAGFVMYPEAVNLTSPGAAAQLADVAVEIGARLVILDTLARCMVGAEENSAKDAGIAVESLDLIRRRTGGCVLPVHHSGMSLERGARGSSAIEAAMDTVVQITAEDGRVTLKTTKQKNHAEGNPIHLRAVAHGASIALSARGLVEVTELPEKAYDTLRTLADIEVAGGIAASVWQRAALSAGVPESSFYKHRAGLVEQGLVSNVGTEKTPRYQVSEAGTLALSPHSHELSESDGNSLPLSPPLLGGRVESEAGEEALAVDEQTPAPDLSDLY